MQQHIIEVKEQEQVLNISATADQAFADINAFMEHIVNTSMEHMVNTSATSAYANIGIKTFMEHITQSAANIAKASADAVMAVQTFRLKTPNTEYTGLSHFYSPNLHP
ncbi:hypothetical protein Q3G72_020320 [Acer saccharum]|nr:hypothetical protein Q3G72_020320 [Acer saccharum]